MQVAAPNVDVEVVVPVRSGKVVKVASSEATSLSVVTVSFSASFNKELTKFFAWAVGQAIIIRDAVTGHEANWNMNLLKSFEEPARNKLDVYIRELLKVYSIIQEGTEVDDAKTLAKEFKESSKKDKESSKVNKESNKVNKESKKANTESKKKETVKKSKKEQKQVEENNNSVSDADVKPKSKKQKTSKQALQMNVDGSLDTSQTYYLDTLPFTTEQIVAKWGIPQKEPKPQQHQYEWKFAVGEQVYSIYDWVYADGTFDHLENAKWYLGGTASPNAKDVIKMLKDTFSTTPKKSEKTKKSIEKTTKKSETTTKKSSKKSNKKESVESEELSEDLDTDSELKMESEPVVKVQLEQEQSEPELKMTKEEMKELFGSDSDDEDDTLSININLDDLE